MSETKAKVKVKHEAETKTKLAEACLSGEVPVKVKKEEPASPVVKKHSEASAKSVKKEAVVAVKVPKKEESSKIKKSEATGKVKVVKKEEVLVSVGTPLKKKKPSTDEPEKKEKKVYSLPGQKHDPPDERDPLRIFYESLYSQKSASEMAEIWMMEHGLLEHDVANKAFERKKKNQASQKLGSPVKQIKEKSEVKLSTTLVKTQMKTSTKKPSKKSTTPNGESKPSKVKRERDSDDEDEEFILKPKKKSKANV